jgi:hypothetical protein
MARPFLKSDLGASSYASADFFPRIAGDFSLERLAQRIVQLSYTCNPNRAPEVPIKSSLNCGALWYNDRQSPGHAPPRPQPSPRLILVEGVTHADIFAQEKRSHQDQ